MTGGRSLLHLQLQHDIGYHHHNVHSLQNGHVTGHHNPAGHTLMNNHIGALSGHHAHLQGMHQHHVSQFARQLTRTYHHQSSSSHHSAGGGGGGVAAASAESYHEASPSSSAPAAMRTPTESIDIAYGSSPRAHGGATSPYSSSPKVALLHKQNNHHHHSIQELIRHFSKRIWRADGGGRRNSCSVSEDKPAADKEEEFRGRSKSLDGQAPRRKITDCEATYRIYDSILKEGNDVDNRGGLSKDMRWF